MLATAHPAQPPAQLLDVDSAAGELPPLIESLVCDTHSAALLVAAVTSIVSRLPDSRVGRTENDLAPLLPKDPTALLAFRHWTSSTDMTADTLAAVIGFFADIESARRGTGQYFADVRLLGADRAAVLHQFTLAEVWHTACRSGIIAMTKLETEFLVSLPELYKLNVGVLKRLLTAAAHDEAPLIGATGQIFFPNLPQRRHSTRRILNEAAILQHNKRTLDVFVRDVSPGGLGIVCSERLNIGQLVRVDLATGRQLSGHIAWYGAGRAGLRFSRTLLPNDPLIRA